MTFQLYLIQIQSMEAFAPVVQGIRPPACNITIVMKQVPKCQNSFVPTEVLVIVNR